MYQHGQSNGIKPIVFHLKDNMDDGDTILADQVKMYKNWYQNKREFQSKTNSHPQIEKRMNINLEIAINEDKNLPSFNKAFEKSYINFLREP